MTVHAEVREREDRTDHPWTCMTWVAYHADANCPDRENHTIAVTEGRVSEDKWYYPCERCCP